MEKLKKRWGISSNLQFFSIILVFALTGSISAMISKPICVLLGVTKIGVGNWFWPLRILIILPIYKFLLLVIGFLFGQYNFFKTFVQKMLKQLGLGFLFK
jgi:hypothetical protein